MRAPMRADPGVGVRSRACRAHTAAVAERDEYVVDTYGMPRDLEVAVCQCALKLIASEADTFETDIPMVNTVGQSAEVISAAQRLSTHSKGHPGQDDSCRATGVISARNADDWDALVTFAAHAYDATVWSKSMEALVSLADEGSSLVVHLLPHEREALVATAGPDRVIPMRQWNRVRRGLLKERRSKSD